LFADLEAQLVAAEAADLDSEVRDRTRRESGLVGLVDRVGGAHGQPLAVTVVGGGVQRGVLRDSGPDWLLLEQLAQAELLVPVHAVLGISGLRARTAPVGGGGQVARRLDLRWALRGLARNRTGVRVVLRDGSALGGTVDRVGADHVELAVHGQGESRRPGAVQDVRLVPLAAVSCVHSAG
jgi:hypothetical protein